MSDLLTPSSARALLDRHGLGARKRLGQHFLVDPNTVRRIVRIAEVGPHDTVLEIGPGLGSLTLGLASAAARVVAVEVDAGLAGVLREVVAGHPNVEVLEADALTTDLEVLCGGPARLVANLPYNVATPLMARVLEQAPSVGSGLVMVQRELGERWASAPGSKAYGAISVKFAYHAGAWVAGVVPPTVFMPPPKVSSVLVGFRRHDPPVEVDDPVRFLALVSDWFGHRRKTVLNSLAASGVERDSARRALDEAGIDASARPEQLTLEAFAALYRCVGADR